MHQPFEKDRFDILAQRLRNGRISRRDFTTAAGLLLAASPLALRGTAAQACASASSEGKGRSQSERALSAVPVLPPCALAMRSAIETGPLCASRSHQSRKPSALKKPS